MAQLKGLDPKKRARCCLGIGTYGIHICCNARTRYVAPMSTDIEMTYNEYIEVTIYPARNKRQANSSTRGHGGLRVNEAACMCVKYAAQLSCLMCAQMYVRPHELHAQARSSTHTRGPLTPCVEPTVCM